MAIPTQADPVAGQRYLLLADISGYTAFLNGVEQAHGIDFSSGIPAGYEVLGALLDAVVESVQPVFDIAKLEGDAVFAVAFQRIGAERMQPRQVEARADIGEQ